MLNKGYLLITDITGYTSFLNRSELDHAQHIIKALFESQLKAITPPLTVSNFQGDAILCYAPAESYGNGTDVLNQIKEIYGAFVSQMEEMQIDPPCSCKVCSNIAVLDLKIFVHFGEYLLEQMGERTELIGSDVILIHRLMKNDVVEKTGVKSYLLITKSACERIGIDSYESSFIPHAESYEHIGEVSMFVAPLAKL